jgi:7-keto-8-aminopelargonate synthetase-like enzyme
VPLAEPLQQVDRVFVRFGGRRLLYFGGCDYFRMASHPLVLRAAQSALDGPGLNVAASRSTTGNHSLYGRLENELARFFGREDAALVSNGYASNLAFAQAVAGEVTHVFLDSRAHGALRDAAQWLAGSASRNRPLVAEFAHRNAADLRRLMRPLPRSARALVMTDGMFSHDGSLARLAEYLDVLPAAGWLLVDDAHGAGTVGARGRGTPEQCGINHERVVQTISLSKAFGVYGGAVLGPREVIQRVREQSRAFNGNTPLPLPLANAALTSLKLLKRDVSYRQRLTANARLLRHNLELPADGDYVSPIVPIHPAKDDQARLRRALLRAGIFPCFIAYAGSPGYFRFVVSSEHTTEQLALLAKVLKPYCRE